MTTRFLLVAFALLFPVYCLAQYEISVSEITVWVRVVDSSGKPVQDLTQGDFEIFEDGKLQTLTCFQEQARDEVDTIPTVEEKIDVTSSISPRRFVLFLDMFNTSPPEYLRIRPMLEDFLKQIQGKNWQVMLAALTLNAKLGVIASFTSDHLLLRTLLLKAPANGMRDSRERNNLRNIRSLLEKAKEDPDFRDVLVHRAFELARTYGREEERNSELSIEALESFAAHLMKDQTGDQHTIIVYVSGGFHADPGRRYNDTINSFLEKEEGYSSSGSLSGTSFDIRRLVKKSVGKLNKMNMTLYTINTRGMYDGSDNIDISDSSLAQFSNSFLQDYQESLARIADETGGAFFQNSNNFKKGLDLILDDLENQYELCYRVPPHAKPGKYHKIEVRVKRKGLDVRHRQGYID